jgi:hypothetical protein
MSERNYCKDEAVSGPARELTLTEIARSYGINSRAYRECVELLGKAEMLRQLEISLREMADALPGLLLSRQPPEVGLFGALAKLRHEHERRSRSIAKEASDE